MSDSEVNSSSAVPPVTKKEIFGWAMFDFANSSYVTVVITAIYSGFFTEYIVPEDSPMRNTYWSLAIVFSTLLGLVLAPLVGAICDLSGRKKKYLIVSTVICALVCCLLYFVQPGDVWFGIAVIAVSFAAFKVSEAFCGSFLPELATPKTMGIISGLGWGIGYFGGIGSLLVVLAVVTTKADDNLGVFIEQNQLAMVATGLFFLIAALPTFILLKDRGRPKAGYEHASFGELFRAGMKNLNYTAREAKEHKRFFQFLRAFLFYNAGMAACISFSGIYARQELGFGTGELTIMFLFIQVSSAIGAAAFGFMDAKKGPKFTLLVTLAIWILGSLLLVVLKDLAAALGVDPKSIFYANCLIMGTGLGALQASSRAVVGILSPKDKAAEMFGFWGMFSQLSALLGMAFGPLGDLLGSLSMAALLVVAFFVLGAYLLTRVDLTPITESEAVPAAS
ncbi:MAG: MFS transporter [Myxococcota bacterium]|nr:MFS transporter [Myxococcota bacterium]